MAAPRANSKFVLSIILSLLATIAISCKDSGNNVTPTGQSITHNISPVQSAGTIEQNDNNFQAKSNSGYIFNYWIIASEHDTSYSTEKSLKVSADTTVKITAKFSEIYTHKSNFTSAHNGQWIYFVSKIEVPTDKDDASGITKKHALFAYNVDSKEKHLKYTSNNELLSLSISHDDNYLSFAQRNNEDKFDVYTFDLNSGNTKKVNAGIHSFWANNSNRLISGNPRGLYIYSQKLQQIEYIDDKSISDQKNVSPVLTQAKWSPDDKNILFGFIPDQNSSEFYRYNLSSNKLLSQTIDGLAFGTYYGWQSSSKFIIVGNHPEWNVFQYSLSTSQAKQLNFKSYLNIAVSPSRDFISFSPVGPSNSISIFDAVNLKIQPLSQEAGQGHLIWNHNSFILTQHGNGKIVKITYPSGEKEII